MSQSQSLQLDALIEHLVFASTWNTITTTDLLPVGGVLDAGIVAAAQLSAIETVASILRQRIRDNGIPKDAVEELRANASKIATKLYEDSGAGRTFRTAHATWVAAAAASAVASAPPSDDAFTAEQHKEAARIAREAFSNIRLGGKES